MITFNINNSESIESNYENGFLPQRNKKNLFYMDTSCRCNLSKYFLSSENRRILKKTSDFNFKFIPITQFPFDLNLQKTLHFWIKELGWQFPTNSLKTIFTQHIFTHIYLWYHPDSKIPIAFSVCYFSKTISHIAYVFYEPQFSHGNLPIRLSLQFIIDSYQQHLNYCYLGRFNPSDKTGYYKRNFPGFEYFHSGKWINYK